MPVKYYKVYNKSQTLYVTVLENGTRTIMDGKGHKVLFLKTMSSASSRELRIWAPPDTKVVIPQKLWSKR